MALLLTIIIIIIKASSRCARPALALSLSVTKMRARARASLLLSLTLTSLHGGGHVHHASPPFPVRRDVPQRVQVPRVAERMAELRQVLLQRVGEAPSWSASHTSSRGEVGVHGHLRRGPRVKSEYMTEKAEPALRHV